MANKNLKFDLTNTSTNNPVDSEKIYSQALIQGGSKESFSTILDVKDIARIRKHDFGDVLQSDSCTFSNEGEGTLYEKLVDACTIKINLELCQATLESSFVANQMKAGASNADFLPVDFQNYITSELAKKMSADLEVLTWQGDPTAPGAVYPATVCTGLIAEMEADVDVIDVVGTTVTASNVIVEMNKVYALIPDAIRYSEDLAIYVSTNVMAAYKQAVAAASAEAYYTKDAEPTFLGIPLKLAQGLPANRMVAGETSNFFLISDLLSDFDEIRILPQLNLTGDDTIRVVGRFKFAVSYAFGGEIVFYA